MPLVGRVENEVLMYGARVSFCTQPGLPARPISNCTHCPIQGTRLEPLELMGSAKRAVRASVQHLRQAPFYRAGRTWPTHENQSVFFRIERAIPKPRTGRWLLRYAILLDELFDDAEQLGVSSGRQCQRSLHLTDNQALSFVPISRRDRALARCISLDEIVRALE